MICWQARSSVLLRYAAKSPEDRAVYKRGIFERVLLLSDILLSCFVVLSVVLFTVAWYSGCCSCFCSCSFSSFWISCGVDGVDEDGVDEGWFCGVKYCCMTECMMLIKSWTCCSEKLGADESALGILTTDRMVYWKNRSDDDSWLDGLSDWLIAKRKRKGADCYRHTGPLVGWLYIWLDKAYLVGVATNCQGSNWWLDTILWCGGLFLNC